MSVSDQVKVYKLTWGYCAFWVGLGVTFAVAGIISIAAHQQTKAAGIVMGALVILLGAASPPEL